MATAVKWLVANVASVELLLVDDELHGDPAAYGTVLREARHFERHQVRDAHEARNCRQCQEELR